jgi:hypothetical protein
MASNDDGKILHRDPVVQRGFTQTENIVLTDTRLSVGARFLYTLLKMHAWQADNAFPGQARLGEIMGIKERMVRLYLAELYQYGHITKEQRGLTQTNRYYIEPLQQVYADCLSERQYITGQERQDIASQDRQPIADKEDSAVKKTQQNKREIAPAPVTGDIPRIGPSVSVRDMAIAPGTPVNRRPDAPPVRPVPKPSDDPAVVTLLDELRAIYPFRDGKVARPALALRTLAGLSPADRDRLKIAAGHYAVSRDGQDGYAKDLHTWIADGEWLEYLTPAKPRPVKIAAAAGPAPRPYTIVRGA